jgi:hypothetical protein
MVKATKQRYADYEHRIGRRERWLGRHALPEPWCGRALLLHCDFWGRATPRRHRVRLRAGHPQVVAARWTLSPPQLARNSAVLFLPRRVTLELFAEQRFDFDAVNGHALDERFVDLHAG